MYGQLVRNSRTNLGTGSLRVVDSLTNLFQMMCIRPTNCEPTVALISLNLTLLIMEQPLVIIINVAIIERNCLATT